MEEMIIQKIVIDEDAKVCAINEVDKFKFETILRFCLTIIVQARYCNENLENLTQKKIKVFVWLKSKNLL